MTHLKRYLAVLSAAITLACCPAYAADDAIPVGDTWRMGWPSMVGPGGNRLPLRTDTPLVDDLAQARLAWITTDRSLGTAKTGSQTWVNSERVEQFLGPDATIFKGNWAGVVVADGRVYGSSWIPAGKIYTAPYKTNKPYEKGETDQVPTRFRVEADDVVVCFDAASGKLLWKAVEPGGLIRAGGKRGGLQVAMAIANGRAFALGSTGRLFAYDDASGKKIWQSHVGAAYKAAEEDKKQAIAAAESGKVVIPDGVEWFTSLVVADGVLISGDYQGAQDVGLKGYDTATGEVKWHLPKSISQWGTPALWKSNGKSWLLTATNASTMQLIDPLNGKAAWVVSGIGKNWTTLCPGQRTVMVNVRRADPKEKRAPGLWGAYRISVEKAEFAWQLPDEPRNYIPTWMDSAARGFAAVRGGRVLLYTEGSKADGAAGRALLLDEQDGRILAEAPDSGSKDLATMAELILWTGDRAYVRSDHSHGASHGGRHPLVAWETLPGKLAPILREGKISSLDLIDFDTAYEVLMHVPLVDGRMFERTDDGRLACYDLRRPKNLETWTLELGGAHVGMVPMPVHLWTDGNIAIGAKSWVPDSEQAAMPYGSVRRRATWEMCAVDGLTVTNNRVAGTIQIGFGTHKAPVEVELQHDGDKVQGRWRRKIPALPEVRSVKGEIEGMETPVRGYPTPWLKDRPWTPAGKNAAGTKTISLVLGNAVNLRESPAALNLVFDHDGRAFTRAGATAFRYSQSWHEVDTSHLTLRDNRIAGKVIVIVNKDLYLLANGDGQPSTAGTVTIEAAIDNKGKIVGTYEAVWGQKLDLSGMVVGTIKRQLQ